MQEEPLNQYDYEMLTQTWKGPYGAAYNATAEACLENGWMDHFGLVTVKGQRAIGQYEHTQRKEMIDVT